MHNNLPTTLQMVIPWNLQPLIFWYTLYFPCFCLCSCSLRTREKRKKPRKKMIKARTNNYHSEAILICCSNATCGRYRIDRHAIPWRPWFPVCALSYPQPLHVNYIWFSCRQEQWDSPISDAFFGRPPDRQISALKAI